MLTAMVFYEVCESVLFQKARQMPKIHVLVICLRAASYLTMSSLSEFLIHFQSVQVRLKPSSIM